ncbi:MAG: toprim domain-containing protein [Terriglobia bacterium]|jgi:DNA primase
MAWVDFKALKQTVSMEMAVACYGVMLQRVNGSYLRGYCPLPTHGSKSSNQTFIVNTDKNAWACHSNSCAGARGGRIGGNVLDFVAEMENCSIREAALKLQEWFVVSSGSPNAPTLANAGAVPSSTGTSRALKSINADSSNRRLPFTLKGIDYSHPYLRERGITVETAKHFGIGFFPGKGCMQGRIVIPIHNEEGILIAYAGRALGRTDPKYKFPALFRKALVLFNLHRAITHGKTVIVVEGFFDCLKVHQAGLACAVALMGCSLSRHQEQLLRRYFHEVILLLDGDEAGRTAAPPIAGRLVPTLATRIVEIPAGRQPDQLGADQIRCLCIPGYF